MKSENGYTNETLPRENALHLNNLKLLNRVTTSASLYNVHFVKNIMFLKSLYAFGGYKTH